MKQISRLTGALLFLVLLLSLPVANAAGDAKLPEGVTPVVILIDGQAFSGKNERGETVKPFAYDGTTYVPIRALGNALGYGVSWDSAKACVVVDTKGRSTSLSTKTGGEQAPLPPGVEQIDKILINKQVFKGYNERGEKVHPFAYDGTTYVPIRALGLALKYEVGWDGATSSVTVTTGGKANVPAPDNTATPVAGQIAPVIDAPTLSGDSANFRVVGDHLTDAYQYQNGVYRNVGGELSVKSGECALLVNGESCKGTVEFITQFPKESNAADKFTVTGFHRSDWVQIAFPMNYVMTGDVYTVEKFVRQDYWPFGATDLYHQWGFAVSAQNGKDPVMPLDNDKNLFEGCNVRILQWDKAGDTVVYFAAQLTLDGKAYTVEGLLAAPNRMAEEERASGSSEEGECWYCGGSGTCPTCGGTGRVSNWMPGTGHTFLDQNCTDCYLDGKCRFCNGTGRG